MAKFLSGRQRNLSVGISSFTENKTVLDTIGKVGIGTTDAGSRSLYVIGDTQTTGVTTLASAGGITTTGGDLYVGDELFIGGGAKIAGFLTATNGYFSGNVSIAGTLTYEDVTNVDAIGLVTARTGVNILSGGLTVVGVSTFSSAIDANDGATIDNIQIGVTGDNEIDTATGNLTIDSAAGTVTIDDQLVVTGVTTFNSSVNVDQNLRVTGVSTFVGVTTFQSDVYVNGDLYVSDDLVFDEFTARNINVTGIATVRNANITGVATITNIIGTGATISRIVSAGTSFAQLQVSGISTFNNGPVFIGSGTTTGTLSQRLQVTGGAYVSQSVGIGTTNPRETLDVIGTIGVQQSGSANRFEIQHNATLNSLDFIFI